MSFPKKYLSKLPSGFAEEIQSMSKEEIDKKILLCENHIYEVESAKDLDENLKAAKEHVKDLSSSYSETKSNETAKIKYCIYVLTERGQA